MTAPILPKAERDALVLRHRTMAERYAMRIARVAAAREYLDDIRAEAFLGLVEASIRFDPARGFTFSTYAAFWVRKQITDYLDEARHVVRRTRASEVRGVAPKIAGAVRSLRQELTREPTREEIAERLGCTVSAIERSKHTGRAYDMPIATNDVDERGVRVVDDEGVGSPEALFGELEDQLERAAAVDRAFGEFEGRDAEILRHRFYGGESLEEVGNRYGISRERVRQLQNRALPRFREALEDHAWEWVA